jgi:hypothetical protein
MWIHQFVAAAVTFKEADQICSDASLVGELLDQACGTADLFDCFH